MSEYHCTVEKINSEKKDNIEKRTDFNQVVQNERTERTERTEITESILDKFFKVKNLNFLVLTTLLYTILNNKEIILMFKNFIPFLFNSANEMHILGNVIIGLIFGILLIMYISFYMEVP